MTSDERRKSLIGKALSIVPAVAVVVVVVSSYFAKGPDVVAARLYGGPPSASGPGPEQTLAWRVVVSLLDRGFYEPVAHLPVTLTAAGASTHGTTDSEGAWEARIDVPPSASDVIDVAIHHDDRLLLSDRVALDPPGWKSAFHRVAPTLSGRRDGDLRVDLRLMRSFVAASFPERVLIEVTHDDRPMPDAKLDVSGEGVTIESPSSLRTDGAGRAWITVRAMLAAATLRVEAHRSSELNGSIRSVLRVQSGAMWLDPVAQRRGILSIASPVANRFAYVTLFTEQARVFGARLALERDEAGGATGSMPMPDTPAESTWIMISPDPQGTGNEPSLLGWPMLESIDPVPTPAAHARTMLLSDGMPAARDVARQRAHAGRLRAMIILALAAMIEAGLLWIRARQAKQELERLLASHADVDEALTRALLGGSRFWLKLVIAAALVAVGFSALAFVMWVGAA